MNLDAFDRKAYENLLKYVSRRSITVFDKGPGIIMRHDVDDNIENSMRMAEIESEWGVKASYYILNTAPYWTKGCFDQCRYLERLGHEVGWHNNVLTEFVKTKKAIPDLINKTLNALRSEGLTIRGSASHGDSLCYQFNYVNYQAFTAYPKNGLNGKPSLFDWEQVEMANFGLEYEAYSIPRDVYLSESGKRWRSEINESDLENESNRVIILVHPQHWKL